MIPTEQQAKALWSKYGLPPEKQTHCFYVAQLALFFAQALHQAGHPIRTDLVYAAALLHDIDKNIQPSKEERHPDTSVRILIEEGMDEVAALVKTHPLHAILDPIIAPKTLEEKVLFLADKMVKYEILTVDKRFYLWKNEQLSAEAQRILDLSYPKTKELEKELFTLMNKPLSGILYDNGVVKFI